MCDRRVLLCESTTGHALHGAAWSGRWLLPAPQPLGALALPVSRPYTLLFFGDDKVARSGRDLLLRELALELALDIALGPASDFFAAHYEGGLIDGDSFGAEVYAEPTFCFCTVGGYTQQSERLREEISAALANLDERAVVADLGRAKRKAYGLLLRAWEQAEDVADMLCSAAASGAARPASILTYTSRSRSATSSRCWIAACRRRT